MKRDLRRDGFPRERVLGAAGRLLDRGFFRIGSEGYAEENETYGLATMRKDHVTIRDDTVVFDYAAKGGQKRVQWIADPDVLEVVKAMKARRGGGEELLAYKAGRRWADVKSAEHQPVPEGGGPGRLQRQGLPHLERDGARRDRAGGLRRGERRIEDRPQASDQAGGRGGRALPGQHSGR